jgi:glycosyltransferase involved in cell wall biosynthesis
LGNRQSIPQQQGARPIPGLLPETPELCIIVPVFNGASTLRPCLEALLRAEGPSREIIVVDDASQDGSGEIANEFSVRVIQHKVNRGCADARNEGAKNARAPILVFVDCDVVIHSDALEIMQKFLQENRDFSAIFGSYDTNPAAQHFVSQYRNLLHHYVHQHGNFHAKTFWTGLGAVRRAQFEQVGGFRGEYKPIEDVALGLDLADAGLKVALHREVLGTHLKRWTLYSTIKADIFYRALPWSTMVLRRRAFTNDLNTSLSDRVSVVATMLLLPLLVISVNAVVFVIPLVLCVLLIAATNAQLIAWYIRNRGISFGLGVIPLHIIYQLCAGVGFGLALLKYAKSALIMRHQALYWTRLHEE